MVFKPWCGIGYSKPYALRHLSLNQMCLPIPPIPHIHLKPTSFLIAISSISSWMMLSIPIPFIMPNRLTSAPYLALGNYAIYAYPIYLTHVPYIMMAVHQTPLSCFVTPIWTMSGLSDFSTIIFTFSIIPYLILFVKHYFRNQHSDCNTSRKWT